MNPWPRLLNKLRWRLHRRRREAEIRQELEFHLEQEAAEARAAGLTDAQARAAARRDLGNRTLVEEDTRDAWGWIWLQRMGQDLRFAGRMVRRRPTFTAAAVLSLALGIGANTAVFSLLDALLLERLPVQRPRELVRLAEYVRDGSYRDAFTYTTYEALRHGSTTMSGVIAMSRTYDRPDQVEERGEKYPAYIQLVSDNYFDVLGIGAIQGRVFHAPAPGVSGEPVAVISEAYWQRHFGGQPSALGARVRLWRHDFTIAGIAPRGFGGTETDTPIDIWVPFEQTVPVNSEERSRGRWMRIMGRLASHETIARAAAESSVTVGRTVTLEPAATGYSNLRRRLARPLLLVELVVGLVLLITCANLANLMLAGTAARERELAVRRSLGASRARVVRQLLTESLVLAGAGGALAVVAARWMSAALLSFLPPQQAPALVHLGFQADWKVLGFASLLSSVTCLLFGLVPALRTTHAEGAPALRAGAGTGQRTRGWMSRGLVVGQVVMCTLLLMIAGVFLRSLQNLRGQDAGYQEDHLLVADVKGPEEYTEERRDQLIEDLRARASSLPGVQQVAFSHHGQLSGSAFEYRLGFPGRVKSQGDAPTAIEQRVSPGFLAAMGTRFVAGRDVTDADGPRATPVAIVNEAFAARFFSGTNPLGQRFSQEGGSRSGELMEVVGVVSNAKWVNLRDEAPAMYYRPYAQQAGSPVVRFATRASGDLDTLGASLVQTAQSIDRRIALSNVVPFREIVDRTLVIERLVAHVAAAFGVLALTIAAVGLYGVLAYGVTRRRREIGVRIAIGASPGSVEWLILRESLVLFAIGCLLGVPAAVIVNRQLSSLLFGLSPQDPVTVTAALVTLAVATVAASYLPARRAASIDPMLALREE
jgi:predicted permease